MILEVVFRVFILSNFLNIYKAANKMWKPVFFPKLFELDILKHQASKIMLRRILWRLDN